MITKYQSVNAEICLVRFHVIKSYQRTQIMLRDGGQALFKREMFGDQTPAIKRCSVTKHDDVVLSGITHILQGMSKSSTSFKSY